MSKDYYKILGVSKDASKADIKKAYKRLAKKYHPDINKEADASDKFKEINEAAAILGDDQKKAQYDQFGSDGMKYSNDFGGFDYSDFSNNFDFGDIFDQFFGGGAGDIFGRRGRGGPSRGSDLRFDIEIDLEEAAFGKKKTIIVPKLETCSRCDGSGAKSKSDIKSCESCHGTGTIRSQRRTPFGIFQTSTPCPKCQGAGQIIREECPVCDGDGRVQKNKKVEIKIPEGVDNGMRLRVPGEGEAGEKGAPSGDLYVMIHVRSHDIFKRSGNDIIVEIPIRFAQAALGDKIEVPTLTSPTKIKIPPGTQPGTIFKLKGKGIPNLNRYGTGDQLIRITIDVPDDLTKKQKELLSEFDGSIKTKRNIFGL